MVRTRRRAGLVTRVSCALAMTWGTGCAGAARRSNARATSKPTVITPKNATSSKAPGAEDLSMGGERRGALEYGLGGVTAAVSVTLIAFGSVQLRRAVALQAFCSDPATAGSNECDVPIGSPPVNYFVSGGLSLGFSIPIAIASGFLFRRAVRTQRAYRAWKAEQVALAPWTGPRAGGLSLSLRF